MANPLVERALEAKLQHYLERHDYASAADSARKLLAGKRTPANEDVLRSVLLKSANHQAEHDRSESVGRLVTEIQSLRGTSPLPPLEIATLYARAGMLGEAFAQVNPLNDPAAVAKIHGIVADRAIRRRSKDGLPPEMQPGCEAILTAFNQYESGNDEAAKTALDAIGLKSPFLEWKLLIRGLTAYSANDDARAKENLSRLSPDRLPYRFAAPIRTEIDENFRCNLKPTEQQVNQEQLRKLTPSSESGLHDSLVKLRSNLAKRKLMSELAKSLEILVVQIRKQAPLLEAGLARVIYREIGERGQQEDLSTYRRLFGAPPMDPEFHRINAMGFEKSDDLVAANRHWASYEVWLATNPRGFSPEVIVRMRAILHYRIAKNIHDENEAEGFDDDFDEFMDLFTARRSRTSAPTRPPKKQYDPIPNLTKAIELAPGWEFPAEALIQELALTKKLSEAESVARRTLKANPNAVGVAKEMADAFAAAKEFRKALEFRLLELAANPLDQIIRKKTGITMISKALSDLSDGVFDDSIATLDAGKDICEESAPVLSRSIRAMAARKQKKIEDAERYQAEIQTLPDSRLAGVLGLAACSILVKLAPANRKPFEQALAAVWKEPATASEVAKLQTIWLRFKECGIEYRGHKTQQKKIQDLATASLKSESTEDHFEMLLVSFLSNQDWKFVDKFAVKLSSKFPTNPLFLFAQFQAKVGVAGLRFRPSWQHAELLKRARMFAEQSSKPHHKALIESLDQALVGFEDFLPPFFRSKFS